MTDKRKFQRENALPVAQSIVEMLRPYCERIEIAGSIRREKPEVSDAEILYVPKVMNRKVDLMFEEAYHPIDEKLDDLLRCGWIGKRPNVRGEFTYGKQNKLCIHWASQIPVDFFSVEARCWYVALVIRTGGKETNLELTTGAQRLGRRLHAYGGLERENGEVIFPDSEREVFHFCNVPYLEPKDRK